MAGDRSALSWDDIRVFLIIARSRTLSAAAPKLSLSQPTLGRRLRAIELVFGSTLFIRTSNGLQLTKDGISILDDAEAMERSALAVERRLTTKSAGLAGELRIASRQWIIRHLLGRPLSTLTRSNPYLILDFVQDSSTLDLSRRDAEVAFRSTFEGQQAFSEPDILQRCLTRLSYDVFASDDYLVEHERSPIDKGGDGHRLIIGHDASSESTPGEPWLKSHFPSARTSVFCSCHDTQALACEQGAGLALLPHSVAERYSLKRVETKTKPPEGSIWLGFHRDLRTLERLRGVIKYLVRSSPRKED